MYNNTAKLINASGLHARPASDFVKLAKTFQSKISIRRVGEEKGVNAKSIVMLLSQGLACGTMVEITAEGEDEETAVKALVELIASGFGE